MISCRGWKSPIWDPESQDYLTARGDERGAQCIMGIPPAGVEFFLNILREPGNRPLVPERRSLTAEGSASQTNAGTQLACRGQCSDMVVMKVRDHVGFYRRRS